MTKPSAWNMPPRMNSLSAWRVRSGIQRLIHTVRRFQLVEERPHRTLAELPVGETARMLRVSDKNPSLLRYLADIALQPGAEVTMVSRAPFDGPLTLRIGHAEFAVGPTLAAQVLVEAMPFAAPAVALDAADAVVAPSATAPSLPKSRKSTVR